MSKGQENKKTKEDYFRFSFRFKTKHNFPQKIK